MTMLFNKSALIAVLATAITSVTAVAAPDAVAPKPGRMLVEVLPQ